MASLVPCIACRRHVRCHEFKCRFCGAALVPTAAREIVLSRDAKRATIFALGLTLAGQACGGESDGTVDPSPPGTGASNGVGATGGSGGSSTGATGGVSNNAGSAGDSGIQNIPVYGAVVPPLPTGGSGGSTGMPDTAPSQDAGADAGNDPPEDAGG